MKHPLRSFSLAAVLATSSFALSSCGDSDDPDKNGGNTAGSAGEQADPPVPKSDPVSPGSTDVPGKTDPGPDPKVDPKVDPKAEPKTDPGGTSKTDPAPPIEDRNMTVTKSDFGEVEEGKVDLYTLTNDNKVEVRIMSYGGTVVSIKTPDRDGNIADIVLGFNTVEEYVKGSPYFGCITGRYANRIAKGKFTLEGQEYTLATNNDVNHLHGGAKGFDKRLWKGRALDVKVGVGVEFTYTSPDGEEGYPGALSCKVTYLLTPSDQLRIIYEATTDKTTVLNLTNHTYWNLKGEGNGDILGHSLLLNSLRYNKVDASMIPTGLVYDTGETPLDFQKPTPIGDRIEDDFEQLKLAKGYDHNYIIADYDGTLISTARVVEPTTGRVLEIYTTEPGVQFYSGNFLDGTLTGKSGKKYEARHGFCLETQHYPDSPNQAMFPSTVLKPGEVFKSVTVHQFDVEK